MLLSCLTSDSSYLLEYFFSDHGVFEAVGFSFSLVLENVDFCEVCIIFGGMPEIYCIFIVNV